MIIETKYGNLMKCVRKFHAETVTKKRSLASFGFIMTPVIGRDINKLIFFISDEFNVNGFVQNPKLNFIQPLRRKLR